MELLSLEIFKSYLIWLSLLEQEVGSSGLQTSNLNCSVVLMTWL